MTRLIKILKIILIASIITLVINLLIILMQILLQTSNQELFVNIGLPYHFFYFNDYHDLHGFNIINFLIDGVIWFLISLCGVLLFRRRSLRKTSKN